MPKAKKSSKRKKFDYNQDRKKMRKRSNKKYNPRIENSQIQNAWDNKKSTAKNLLGLMGLAFDPNRTVPIKKSSILLDMFHNANVFVAAELQKEANVPERDCKTLSSDLIEYAQYMIREHNDDFKAMAQDEKNYYQDTPKQIKRKINEYMRCHPDAFMDSLAAP
uniref:LOW QUALITY PROTEIN: nucleolar protein 16 n=1 Tax=Gasterosteus aculeatus aculeatus TaxID=481459 RepID=UPI001A9A213B|nr:LOW QUALITY PROTEIN: nucleolar protein 16 [Gasterosteus aculeatus aculeatus]